MIREVDSPELGMGLIVGRDSRIKNRGGFTLVEAAVSMLILGIVVLVSSLIFRVSNQMHSQAEEKDKSYTFARDKMITLQSVKRDGPFSGTDTIMDSKGDRYIRLWEVIDTSGGLKGRVQVMSMEPELPDTTTITAIIPKAEEPEIRLIRVESGDYVAGPGEKKVYLGYVQIMPFGSPDTLDLSSVTFTAIDNGGIDERDNLDPIRIFETHTSQKPTLGSPDKTGPFDSNDSGQIVYDDEIPDCDTVYYFHVFCNVTNNINVPSNLRLMVDFDSEGKDESSAPRTQSRGTDFKILEPTAVITVTPSDEVLTGDTVTFDGSASSDPDGNIVSWSWDLTGDGSTNSTDTVTTHTYSSAGTYTVSLEVEDDSGYTDVDSVEITVSDPQPPEAVINPDSVSGTDSVTVEFDGSGSDDPDGGNLTYKWYILEPSVEQVSSDSTFDTTFLIGDYTVVLEVTDDEGETDTDTALVSVTTSSAPQNQLTIYSSGDGSVDPNHDPAEGYDEGDTVDISTTPDADNQFYKWSGDTLDGVTDADPDIIMNTNRYVIADFRADSELVGTDIITNGDFTNSTNNWEFNYDGRDGAAGNFSTDSGALKINISDGGSADWHIQPRQTGLTFRKGYTYTVSFIARASASRPLNISLSQNYDPYKRYAQKDVTLTEEYQKFSFSFTHDTSSDSDSRICFNSGTDANDIWIDNVVVSEVSPCAGNNPPTAVYIDVVPSSEGDVNTNYEFVGSRSTDPDGNIDTYSWDFGDGSSATGDTVYHSYDSANIYTVTLTVIDECGDSLTNDMNVEVTGGEPTPDIIISQENTEYSADISSPKEVYMDTSNYNFGNLGIERESSSSTIQLNMEIDWLNGNTTVINDWSDNITVQSYYFKITDLGGETDLLLKGW